MTAPLNLDALQALCAWDVPSTTVVLSGVPHRVVMESDFKDYAAARSAMPALIQEVRRRGELVERAYREGLSRGFHHDDHEHVIDTDKEWKASEVHSALHNGQ